MKVMGILSAVEDTKWSVFVKVTYSVFLVLSNIGAI